MTLPNIEDFRTDHLILLVGGNPLPNYVAGRLLAKEAQNIYFVHTSQTEDVAKTLYAFLRDGEAIVKSRFHLLENPSEPAKIYESIKGLIDDEAFPSGTVGLHYTGGTKLMAAHAHRAARDSNRSVVLSYLDPRTLKMVFDNGLRSGEDEAVSVAEDSDASLTVHELMKLHGITLQLSDKKPNFRQTVPPKKQAVSDAILEEDISQWSNTITRLIREWDKDELKFNYLLADKMRQTAAPNHSFPSVWRKLFEQENQQNTLLEGALALGYKKAANTGESGKKDMENFAKFMEGEWLEIQMFRLLQVINSSFDNGLLKDIGMNYVAANEKNDSLFEFDVAATRGYRLFAISCTTSSDKDLCKSKLFEANYRAKQMGGDEARTALLCAHPKPNDLLRKFRRDFGLWDGAAHVFSIAQLKEALANPDSAARKEFICWLEGKTFNTEDNKWE